VRIVIAGAIQSGRGTRSDDAAATPRPCGCGCYRRGAMEVGMHGRGIVARETTWHAWRHHVDLCRTAAALCRR
jgi:hypothetical protein